MLARLAPVPLRGMHAVAAMRAVASQLTSVQRAFCTESAQKSHVLPRRVIAELYKAANNGDKTAGAALHRATAASIGQVVVAVHGLEKATCTAVDRVDMKWKEARERGVTQGEVDELLDELKRLNAKEEDTRTNFKQEFDELFAFKRHLESVTPASEVVEDDIHDQTAIPPDIMYDIYDTALKHKPLEEWLNKTPPAGSPP